MIKMTSELFKLELESGDERGRDGHEEVEEIRTLIESLKDTMGNSKHFMQLEGEK